MADARDKEQPQQQQQQQKKQRPVSAGSGGGGDSDSSYESLQFWKNPTSTPTLTPGPTLSQGMNAPMQSSSSTSVFRGDQRPGQVGRVGHKGGARYEFREGDDGNEEKDSTAIVETDSDTTGPGRDITVSMVVDDYADIIDQYAGGWVEGNDVFRGVGGVV